MSGRQQRRGRAHVWLVVFALGLLVPAIALGGLAWTPQGQQGVFINQAIAEGTVAISGSSRLDFNGNGYIGYQGIGLVIVNEQATLDMASLVRMGHDGGKGYIYQNSGTVQGNQLWMGSTATGTGTILLAGGSFSVNTVYLGDVGFGSLMIVGAKPTINIGSLHLGGLASNLAFELTDDGISTVNVAGIANFGGSGTNTIEVTFSDDFTADVGDTFTVLAAGSIISTNTLVGSGNDYAADGSGTWRFSVLNDSVVVEIDKDIKGPPHEDEDIELTIVSTNDVHQVLSRLPRVATYVKDLRETDADTLFFDSGDQFGRGEEEVCEYSDGEAIYGAMALMGYDAVTLGNHEWGYEDRGGQRLVELMNLHHELRVVCANIESGTVTLPNEPTYQDFIVKEVKGLRIGIIGLHGGTGYLDGELRNTPAEDAAPVVLAQMLKSTTTDFEVIGDFNDDGVLDTRDVASFDQALSIGAAAWESETGRSAVGVGDFNGDDSFDGDDTIGFIDSVFRRPPNNLTPVVDLIFALTHLGWGDEEQEEECEEYYSEEYDDKNLACDNPEIDVIFGGHSHTDVTTIYDGRTILDARYQETGVITVQARDSLYAVGKLTLWVNPRTKRIIRHEFESSDPRTWDLVDDETVLEFINSMYEDMYAQQDP